MDFRDPFVSLAEVYNVPVDVNSAPADRGRMPPQEAKRVYNLWFDLVELEEHTTTPLTTTPLPCFRCGRKSLLTPWTARL